MSGGSYDYLYLLDSLHDLPRKLHHLRAMRDRLGELAEGAAPAVGPAAEFTRYFVDLIDSVEALLAALPQPLRDVWHAVEWLDSSDYGIAEVQEAGAAFTTAVVTFMADGW